MKPIPTALRAQIAAGAATLCHCWKLTRRDGTVMGFTDHDHDLSFDGVTYRAASGFTPMDARGALGLSAEATEVAGVLSADALRAADLAAGRYDGAEVEVWLVDWRDPATRALMTAGDIGRVRRGALHFEAELRGLAHRLQRPRGRVHGWLCDAEVGDARCGVNLKQPAYSGDGGVLTVISSDTIAAEGLSGYADGWFTGGVLHFTSGGLVGRAFRVKRHVNDGGDVRLRLEESLPEPPAAGDGFHVTVGCDHRMQTCREKFGNVLNFRGFPHMPGNDFVTGYAHADDANDGAPVVP